MEEKSNSLAVAILSAVAIIIAAAGFLFFKLGQKSIVDEKCKEYDDCCGS